MNAKEMAATFGVSVRTARRYIARGTTPDPRRTVGRDGKTYPCSYISYARTSRDRPANLLTRDLVMARNAVRRLAHASAFSDHNLTELRTIASEACDLLCRWTTPVESARGDGPTP
jgi:hypothetical protein